MFINIKFFFRVYYSILQLIHKTLVSHNKWINVINLISTIRLYVDEQSRRNLGRAAEFSSLCSKALTWKPHSVRIRNGGLGCMLSHVCFLFTSLYRCWFTCLLMLACFLAFLLVCSYAKMLYRSGVHIGISIGETSVKEKYQISLLYNLHATLYY